MAKYLALGIEENRFDYLIVVNNPKLARFKKEIDVILTANEKQDLIKS